MKAIHLKCERISGNLKNVTYDKSAGLFRSGQWDIPVADAEALRDGWLYLHAEKAARSEFGGTIADYEIVTDPSLARKQRIVFLIRRRPEGDGQKWRGKAHGMAHSSGPVEAIFPHERQP